MASGKAVAWVLGGLAAAAIVGVAVSAKAKTPPPGVIGPSSSPTPLPPPVTANIVLAPGVLPAVTLPGNTSGNLSITIPGLTSTQGGSIVSLAATSGYLLGDNVPGPEAKPVGTPPGSGTAGSNTGQLGWNFYAASKGTTGTITVVWYDVNGQPQQTQIPVTLT